MKRSLLRMCALWGAMAIGASLGGCVVPPPGGDDTPDNGNMPDDGGDMPEMKTLALTFDGLEPLGEGFVYEGWLIVDDNPVSTGRFHIVEGGLADPAEFEMPAEQVDAATVFVLTIEPAVGDDPAPADTHVLGGDWDSGAALTVGHAAALGDDFATAAGPYILETPSTSDVAEDYAQGIWWLDPAAGPGASLVLPDLPAGWAYEGWVVGDDGPVSTGRFTSTDGADADGVGPTSGPDDGPPFPGQDFIDPAVSIAGFAAVISVEPDPDDSPAPFALKPLVDTDIEDVGAGVLQDMASNIETFPLGTATVLEE